MSNNKKFISIIFTYSLLAFLFGIFQVSNGNFSGPSTPFVPLGILIWGDAVILGLFLTLASVVLWGKNDVIWTGLFFSAYVGVRAFIELLYWLNLQFTSVTRPWEKAWLQFSPFKSMPLMEFYVLGQLMYTIIVIIAILIFIKFFKQYLKEN
jgi:hypothetical protein